MRRPGAKRPKFLAIAAFYSCSGWKISTKGVGIFYFRRRETIIVFGDVNKRRLFGRNLAMHFRHWNMMASNWVLNSNLYVTFTVSLKK